MSIIPVDNLTWVIKWDRSPANDTPRHPRTHTPNTPDIQRSLPTETPSSLPFFLRVPNYQHFKWLLLSLLIFLWADSVSAYLAPYITCPRWSQERPAASRILFKGHSCLSWFGVHKDKIPFTHLLINSSSTQTLKQTNDCIQSEA